MNKNTFVRYITRFKTIVTVNESLRVSYDIYHKSKTDIQLISIAVKQFLGLISRFIVACLSVVSTVSCNLPWTAIMVACLWGQLVGTSLHTNMAFPGCFYLLLGEASFIFLSYLWSQGGAGKSFALSLQKKKKKMVNDFTLNESQRKQLKVRIHVRSWDEASITKWGRFSCDKQIMKVVLIDRKINENHFRWQPINNDRETLQGLVVWSASTNDWSTNDDWLRRGARR